MGMALVNSRLSVRMADACLLITGVPKLRCGLTIGQRMMETATAATAAGRTPVGDLPVAAQRLRELAAHLRNERGFTEVLASLKAGHGGTLGGVWGSSRALVAAALAQSCPGPLVIVAPHSAEIDPIARDLALFTDARVVEFPAWESEPGERVVYDEIYGERLRVLKELRGSRIEDREDCQRLAPRSLILVTSIQSLLQPVPSRDSFASATREIRVGAQFDVDELARWLTERGAHATTAVELPGEFSMRGGILDIFAPDAEDPIRVELFGDEVESIRRFDVATQRSLATLDATTITMLAPTASDRAHFTSYLPHVDASLRDSDPSFEETRLREAWFLLIEPNELQEEGKFYLERMDRPQALHSVRTTLEEIYKFPSVTAAGVPSGSVETTAHLGFESVERFSGEIGKVRDELAKVSDGAEVFVVCETDAEVERLTQLLLKGEGGEPNADTNLSSQYAIRNPQSEISFVVGHLEAGFRIVQQRVV